MLRGVEAQSRLPRSPGQRNSRAGGGAWQGSGDSAHCVGLTAEASSPTTVKHSGHSRPPSPYTDTTLTPTSNSPSRLPQPGYRASPDAKALLCLLGRDDCGGTAEEDVTPSAVEEGGSAAACEESHALTPGADLKVTAQLPPPPRTPVSPPQDPDSGFSVHSNAIFGDSEGGQGGASSPLPVVSLWEGHASPNSFGSPVVVTGGALPSRVASPADSPGPPPAPSNAASPFDAYWVQTNEAFVPLSQGDMGAGGLAESSSDLLRRNDSAISDHGGASEVEVSINCGSIPTTVSQPRAWAASSELPTHLQASAPVLMRQRPTGDPMQRLACTQGGTGFDISFKKRSTFMPHSISERIQSDGVTQPSSASFGQVAFCDPSGHAVDRRNSTSSLAEASPNFYRRQWCCIAAAHQSAKRRRRQQTVLLLKWRTWTIEEQALRGAKFEHGIRTMLKLRNNCLLTGYLLSFAWLRWVTVCRHRLAAVQIAEALAEQTLSLSVCEEEQCQHSVLEGDITVDEPAAADATSSEINDLVAERLLAVRHRCSSRKAMLAVLHAWRDACTDTPSVSCDITLSLGLEEVSELLLPLLRSWAQYSRSTADIEAALVSRCRRVSDMRRVVWAWRRWTQRLHALRVFQRDALRLFNNNARRRLLTAWQAWRMVCGSARVLDHKLDAGYQRLLLAKAMLGLSQRQQEHSVKSVLPSPKPPTPKPSTIKATPSVASQKRAASTANRKSVASSGSRPPKSPSYVSMVSGQYPSDVHFASSLVEPANGAQQALELSGDAAAVRHLQAALKSLQSEANARITYQNGRLAHLRGVVSRMALAHASERKRRALFAAFSRWRCNAALGRLSMKPYRSDPFVVVRPPPRKESTLATNSYVQAAKLRQTTSSAGPSSRPPAVSPGETATSHAQVVPMQDTQEEPSGLNALESSQAVCPKLTARTWRADTPPLSPSPIVKGSVASGGVVQTQRELWSCDVTSGSTDSASTSAGQPGSSPRDGAESQSPSKRRCGSVGSHSCHSSSSAKMLAALGLQQLQAIADVPLVDLTASGPLR